jgi:hypothetical protein
MLSNISTAANESQTDEPKLVNLTDLPALGTTARAFNALNGMNLGYPTLQLTLPMYQFFEMSEVANRKTIEMLGDDSDREDATQRPLDTKHARKLAAFILKGLVNQAYQRRKSSGQLIPEELEEIRRIMGTQPYMALQPLVVNLRNATGLQVERTRNGVVTAYLSDRDVLWVVDGQHRRYAMQLVFEFLKYIRERHVYPRRSKIFEPLNDMTLAHVKAWTEIFEVARESCTVTVEVHLGLNDDQERQLFHDLNNLGKKVEASLSFEFDNSNPINRFLRDELEVSDFWKPEIVTRDNDWRTDEGQIARKDLVVVNSHLFLNSSNPKGAKPVDVDQKSAEALQFWEAVNRISGFGEHGAKQKTVAAQPVVLKALAKLFYDLTWAKQQNSEHRALLLEGINGRIDFSHDNPMWRYYELTEEDRRAKGLAGLEKYLPYDAEGANRDLGKYDSAERVMKFSLKHNDIYPILADMIRWRLSLPNRHQ